MGEADAPSTTPPSWSKTFRHYNPLHYRRHNTSAPVYSRDFAYAHTAASLAHPPMRAQRADINAETSAKTFAEYVRPTSYLSAVAA